MSNASEEIAVLAQALDTSTNGLTDVLRDEPLDLFENRLRDHLELMRRLEAQVKCRPLPAGTLAEVKRMLAGHWCLVALLQDECQNLLDELHLVEESRRNLANLSDGYADSGQGTNVILTA